MSETVKTIYVGGGANVQACHSIWKAARVRRKLAGRGGPVSMGHPTKKHTRYRRIDDNSETKRVKQHRLAVRYENLLVALYARL